MTISAGRLLGPYQVEALIGAGGMGEVYKARDRRLDRLVAVKVLVDPLAKPTRRQRFEREAAAIARLTHPHICRLYDVGAEAGLSYLVMEYLEGETLAQRIADPRPIAVPEALEIAGQIVDAVHAAHRHGLVHRDLKPSNVMLTSAGVKLLDFGLVGFLDELADEETRTTTTSTLTGEGGVLGTIRYMSPEQVLGRPADSRSDVFALGVIIYEMLTRQSPFARKTSTATVAAIAAEDAPPIRTVRSEVTPALERVIARCLAKDPRQRWPDGGALLGALDVAGRIGPSKRVAAAPRRSRAGSVPHQIRRIAVMPLRNISGDSDEDYLADGVTEAVMSALTRIGGLEIISRASANRLADTGVDPADLARSIHVDAWIEGTVLKRSDQVQVAVRLMESASESQVWRGTYERARPDLSGVQSEIATHLATEIQLKISSTERRHAPKRAPKAAAHDAYLRARFYWSQLSAEALRLSFKHFQSAVEIDPDYALAHAGLSDWYLTAVNARLISAFDGIARARAAAMRALQLSPRLAQSHCSLGRVALHEWDLLEATVELEAALRLDPNLAQAELVLSRLHTYTGNFPEALQHVRVVQDLDPLSPATHVNAAATLYSARRFGEAIDEARRSLDLAPEFGNAVYLIGLCEHFRGNSELALAHLARARELSPEHPSPASASAYVLAQLGRREEALDFVAALKERATRGDASPFDFAEAYAGFGETDLTLEHLERSLDLRSPALLGIGSDPLFDPIRSEPRFQALLSAIGLV